MRGVTKHRTGWAFGGVAVCALTLLLTQSVAVAGAAGSAEVLPGEAPLNPAFEEYLATGGPSATDGAQATGYVPSPLLLPSWQGMQLSSDFRLAETLPVSYDLRTLNRVTPVKNQSPRGVCWAFAGLGSLESCLLKSSTAAWDFSEDNLALAAGFDDNDGPYDGPYYGGNQQMTTAYLVRWGGPVLESQDPYGDSILVSGLARQKHVQEVIWLPRRTSPTDNDAIKNALVTYGGVAAAMYHNGSSAINYYYAGGEQSNHEVLIVGWDDTYPAANFSGGPAGNGAFIVKNSWGTTYGEAGYFYVSYYDACFAIDADMAVYCGAQPTTNYSRIYQHDPLGAVSSYGYSDSMPFWYANAFTAASTATVAAAGFYTRVPDTSYEVYGGSSLAAMTKLGYGTVAYPGYHTAVLSKPLAITKNTPFLISVKVWSNNGSWAGVEYAVEDYTSKASADWAQSYFSPDGKTWTDMTTVKATANLCLKAYEKPLPAPTVTGVSPTGGLTTGTNYVAITGTNFIGVSATGAVTFGGVKATYTVNSSTKITAKVPAHAAGRVDVRVTAAGGTSANTSKDDYTYSALYQQTDAKLTYLGSWTSAATSLASGGSFISGDGTGAAVLVNFTGTSVQVLARKAPWYGKAAISIDDGSATIVDLYSSSTLYKKLVYQKVGLASAAHTMVIKRLGQKNSAATGYSISLDALQIGGSLTQAAKTTAYQQDYAKVRCTGTWTKASSAAASGGTYASANVSGAKITLTFNGSYLAWFAKTAPWYGKAKVTLDGGTPITVDLYGSAETYKKMVYNTGLLAKKAHTLVIQWTGTKRTGSWGTAISADVFGVLGSLY